MLFLQLFAAKIESVKICLTPVFEDLFLKILFSLKTSFEDFFLWRSLLKIFFLWRSLLKIIFFFEDLFWRFFFFEDLFWRFLLECDPKYDLQYVFEYNLQNTIQPDLQYSHKYNLQHKKCGSTEKYLKFFWKLAIIRFFGC